MEQLHLLTETYPGWSLTDIKSLSRRERYMWLMKATVRKVGRG